MRIEKDEANGNMYALDRDRFLLSKERLAEIQNSSDSSTDEESCTMEELEEKHMYPNCLDPAVWFNDSGRMNGGPLCRCSANAKTSGIHHGIYAGEEGPENCNPWVKNANRLFHYRIMIYPPTNFLTDVPTVIKHDEHEFKFEGFSMFSHEPLDELPACKVIRFNIEYTIVCIEEKCAQCFSIMELNMFYEVLFHKILELKDLDFGAHGKKNGCPQFHFMPRFVRELEGNVKEILPMARVVGYLVKNGNPLIEEKDIPTLLKMPESKWQNFVDEVKGTIVTKHLMKPQALRVDQLTRSQQKEGESNYPEIIHFRIQLPLRSYYGNPEYQKLWREYVKFKYLLANMPKPTYDDKQKLELKKLKWQEMKIQIKAKQNVKVAVSAKGYSRTGIRCDIVEEGLLIPVLVCHLRFHWSCAVLENKIGYKFKNRYLLQLALTDSSYRENFGTNADHARNMLINCGIHYEDKWEHYLNATKTDINKPDIMSHFGKKTETQSNITHNERLQFLGNAVVKFLSSAHLFHTFPDLEMIDLLTYREAIVQDEHLAVLAEFLNLGAYMRFAHSAGFCHLKLQHAMANCFEALMGALFLDGGIEAADKVFGETLLKCDAERIGIWTHYPPHPLQQQEPEGDRKLIPSSEFLQKLTEFEDATGIQFNHIQLLARAFTVDSIRYTNSKLGYNQSLVFLGDTVLWLIVSEYLYKQFPEHHERHLSLLHRSLIINGTLAVVYDDLGMAEYVNPKIELTTVLRACLLQAFLGALYVDQGMQHCQVFCNVCLFPRLQQFIMNQGWDDPKSKLEQCYLTLPVMKGREPDIPYYRVIARYGAADTWVYTAAVYFRGSRLAKASGPSIQQAQMNVVKKALDNSHEPFAQLDQKKVSARRLRKQMRLKFPLHRECDDDRDSNKRKAQRMTDSSRSFFKHDRESPFSPEQCTSTASMTEPGTSGGNNTLTNQGGSTTTKMIKTEKQEEERNFRSLQSTTSNQP